MNNTEMINNNVWTDWCLNRIVIDGDAVIITISDNIGNNVTITCNRFIGLNYIGQWEEGIIQDINIKQNGKIINESIDKIKKLYDKNYLASALDDNWNQMDIDLIDGNTISIAFSQLNIEL